MRTLLWICVAVLAWRVLPVAWQEGVDRMTPVRAMEEVFDEAVAFATETWLLSARTCPEGKKTSGEGFLRACFSTTLNATQFAELVQQRVGQELREETGWRDDYGVLSAGFIFKNQVRYSLGLIYQRRDSSPELRHDPALAGAAGTVSVIVEEAVPLPGE